MQSRGLLRNYTNPSPFCFMPTTANQASSTSWVGKLTLVWEGKNNDLCVRRLAIASHRIGQMRIEGWLHDTILRWDETCETFQELHRPLLPVLTAPT